MEDCAMVGSPGFRLSSALPSFRPPPQRSQAPPFQCPTIAVRSAPPTLPPPLLNGPCRYNMRVVECRLAAMVLALALGSDRSRWVEALVGLSGGGAGQDGAGRGGEGQGGEGQDSAGRPFSLRKRPPETPLLLLC